jgi:MFS family permease
MANRDLRIYLSGQILSSFGDSALWLAMGIWTKMLTGSASAAAMTFFMFALGNVFGPIGGAIADRVRRLPLLSTANALAAVLVLTLLFVRDERHVWIIYVVMLGYGLCGSVLNPTQTALLQTIAPPELLREANSVLQTAQQGMRLVTPMLGAGLLAAFGATPVIIGDAVTFVIVIVSLAVLRISEEKPAPYKSHWFKEFAAGAVFIARAPALRQLLIAGVVAVTAFGLSEAVAFAVVSDGLRRPDTFLGVVTTAQGVGAIVAGAAAAVGLRAMSERLLVSVGLLSASVGFILQIFPEVSAVLVGAALLGAGLPWIAIGVTTIFQMRTPSALMGRVDAALSTVLSVSQTIAIAVGASLLSVLHFKGLLLIIAALVAVAGVYLAAIPAIRAKSNLSTAEDDEMAGQAAADDLHGNVKSVR